MKLIEDTPDVLRMRHYPALQLWLGGVGTLVFGIAAICAGLASLRGYQQGEPFLRTALAAVGCSLAAALGLVLLRTAEKFELSFDLPGRKLRLTTERVLSKRVLDEEYPFAAVEGAEVTKGEEDTYGVQLLFRERQPLLVTPVLTSGRAPKDELARRINEVLRR
jgi:hypothetical protein